MFSSTVSLQNGQEKMFKTPFAFNARKNSAIFSDTSLNFPLYIADKLFHKTE